MTLGKFCFVGWSGRGGIFSLNPSAIWDESMTLWPRNFVPALFFLHTTSINIDI